MRISDWSSDVCSSDLRIERIEHQAERTGIVQIEIELGVAAVACSGTVVAVAVGCEVLHGDVVAHHTHFATDTLGQSPCGVAPVAGLGQEFRRFRRWRAPALDHTAGRVTVQRSEEHTSELQSLMRISYAVI